MATRTKPRLRRRKATSFPLFHLQAFLDAARVEDNARAWMCDKAHHGSTRCHQQRGLRIYMGERGLVMALGT